MQKYEVLERAGSGNFSEVYKARDIKTGNVVAIKQMKKCEDVEQMALKQLKILANISHPNIVQFKEVIMQQGDIRVVFEYIDQNLLQLYESSRTGVNENQIKCILYQSAFALEYLHSEKKIIHRDIKPENILIDRKKALVKVIDFGLAKQEQLATTDYVATRWYRSPQNLIGLRRSTTAIDIFALACVIVQLFTLHPLFPGQNTLDQLYKVFSILGTPTETSWPAGYYQMKRKGISTLPKSKVHLKFMIPNASQSLIDLLQQMLELNPEKRIKALDIMMHPFFQKIQRVIPDNIYKQTTKYIKDRMQKKGRFSVMKSLSPSATISSVRYFNQNSPQPKNESFTKELHFKDSNKIQNGFNFPNKNVSPQFHLNSLQTAQLKQIQNQSKIKYTTPTSTTSNPILNFVSSDLRQKRMISLNHLSFDKRTPLPSRRDDQKHLGVDKLQLQNINKKIHHNGGPSSPKYNVRYFKEPSNTTRSKRNLSLVAPNSRILFQKSMQHHPHMNLNSNIKNVLPSRVNFKST